MIGEIGPEHYNQFLRLNETFVHWLSPMNEDELRQVLSIATYSRQIAGGQGVLIGYAHDASSPNHKNLAWLNLRLEGFFYIDRIIISAAAQGKGYGRKLYEDVENYARQKGFTALACEVNTRPNNPRSHAFHRRLGFEAIGDVAYPEYNAALRYYQKPLQD